MTRGFELSTTLIEEAGDWFLRVRSARADSELHTAWLAWIEADPAHREAFAEVQALWDAVGQVDPPPWPSPEELAELAPERITKPTLPAVSAEVRRAPSSSFPSRTRQLSRWALAAGVMAAIVGLLLTSIGPGAAKQRIATSRGEQQSAVLADGSRIELGGLTGVDVQFTPARRLVIAEEGEVFYRVEHDPRRPFVVSAGPISVTAIGTAFSVRREAGAVSVVVTEGIVEVTDTTDETAGDSVRVKAGERVRFDAGRLQAVPQPVHIDQENVWRRGRLRFEDEPLRVVVASLNRYTSRPIVIGDERLEELRFTGTLFDDRVEDWLAGAQFIFPVRLDTSDPKRIVIHHRTQR